MAVFVGTIHVVVVVFPVARASVVGRIDVDAVHFAGAGEGERFECVVVFAVDDHLIGPVPAALNAPGLFKSGVYGLIILCNGNKVANGRLPGRLVVFIV